MAALNTDTRLVMTILFVGVLSGTNVFVYANFGKDFPYTTLAHATLFGLGTIGAIMVMKALFDLSLNDRIEMWLLDRKIVAYWERKARDEQQRQKMRESVGNLEEILHFISLLNQQRKILLVASF